MSLEAPDLHRDSQPTASHQKPPDGRRYNPGFPWHWAGSDPVTPGTGGKTHMGQIQSETQVSRSYAAGTDPSRPPAAAGAPGFLHSPAAHHDFGERDPLAWPHKSPGRPERPTRSRRVVSEGWERDGKIRSPEPWSPGVSLPGPSTPGWWGGGEREASRGTFPLAGSLGTPPRVAIRGLALH